MKKVYLSVALVSLSIVSFAQTKNPYIQAVDEFVPAPGQFTNSLPEMTATDTPESAAKKCTDLIANNKKGMISLGPFGGYITFHFDHPIINVENANDFKVIGNASIGNASKTNNEPGIVMVSQDTNGNGKPDDKWYELSGSADVDCPDQVIYNYEITYKPNATAAQEIHWTDNQGKEGVIPRNDWHKQEYYPLWIKENLTFKGTLLPHNSIKDPVSGWYVQKGYRWGYADNKSDENNGEMDIANAVDENRKKVVLPSIDFVRVYTAINHVVPAGVGDMSTEILGAEDLHPLAAGIDAPLNSNEETTVKSIYSIEGKQLKELQHGINIVKFTNGKVKKVVVK